MAAEINIYGYIGEDLFFGGVSLKSISDQLSAITDNELTVNISSGGGSVNEGKAIYTLLKNSNKDITVKVIGQAYSIASVIMMCGNKILIGEFADVMIHPAWTYAEGNADALRETADQLEVISNELFDIYMTKDSLKKNETKLREYFDSEKVIGAKECIELGLADGYLEDSKNQIKRFIPLKAVAYYSPKNINMNNDNLNEAKGILQTIKEMYNKLIGAVKNLSSTAADGTVIYSESAIAVGVKCFSDEAMVTPLADGSYDVDGTLYTVAGGEVTSAGAEDKTVDLQNKITELTAQLETLNAEKAAADLAKTEAENKVIETEAKLNTEVTALNLKVTELSNILVGEDGRHTEEDNDKNIPQYDKDKKNFITNLKNFKSIKN